MRYITLVILLITSTQCKSQTAKEIALQDSKKALTCYENLDFVTYAEYAKIEMECLIKTVNIISTHKDKDDAFGNEYAEIMDEYFFKGKDKLIENKIRSYFISEDLIKKYNLAINEFNYQIGYIQLESPENTDSSNIYNIGQNIHKSSSLSSSTDKKTINSFESDFGKLDETKIGWKYRERVDYINSSNKLWGDNEGINSKILNSFGKLKVISILIVHNNIHSEVQITYKDKIDEEDVNYIIEDIIKTLTK